MSYKLLHSESEIISLLNSEINKIEGSILIQAGHFALVQDQKSKCLVPGIIEDINDLPTRKAVQEHPYMGEFPLKTWELALKLVSDNPDRSIKISIIVNDWQWVPKSIDGEQNDLRSEFYKNNKTIPKSFEKLLIKYNLSKEIILSLVNDKESFVFFGEQKMRNRAKREFPDLNHNNNSISCAVGYLPFLSYVDRTSFSLLISLVPKTCQGPINFGTEYFMENHVNNMDKLINLFFNGTYRNDFFEEIEYIDFH